ncbi:MAG TPA: hypothetical protein ENJ20_02640 [Bacteroidetes bacterium]|nr:hypothetical protein [Bacteroidota bacterium]
MNKNILNDLLNTRVSITKEELNAYLSGSASAQVRHKVENAMLDDPLYSDAVEGYQEMGLQTIPPLENFSDFKKKLPAHSKAKVVRLTPLQIVARAAAVAAVVLLAVVGFNALQNPSPDALYSAFYTPYQNDISLSRRGNSNNLNPDFKAALGNYATGNYSAAIEGFEKALQAEPANDAAHFFAGMALLELTRYKEALHHFNAVRQQNGTYARKASWYAILATLQSDGTKQAKELLNDFLKKPGYKSKEARKLLNQL